jgi:glycosyltransferase involved in cell wall biosynthesis
LLDALAWPARLFHALNQRVPKARYRRTVSTFHDLFVLTAEYSTAEFRQRFAFQAREAAARSDLIIAVSGFTALQVEELLRVERSRIRVVHHGVHMPSGNDPYRMKSRKIVLHVGAIQTRKNIGRLVQAFESLPDDWHLVLAGSLGYGAAEIMTRIEESPARARIHTPGYVTRAQLDDLYAKACILAFPSLDEGFGIPVLEAMAWGVPVLVSDRSGVAEASGDAGLMVDPLNVEEIAFSLRTLAENDGLRKMLIGKGLERAAEFTWQKAAQSTWSVYQELMS